jgi:hypothetical protein
VPLHGPTPGTESTWPVITGHGQYGYDRRWQLTTRRLITTFKSAQDQEGIAAAFSPDGKTLADNFGAQTHLYSLG